MFDPMYDCYGSMCRRSGGVVVPVPLNPDDDWSIPRDALAAAFTPRTKLLLINTPHNPTGRLTQQCTWIKVAGIARGWQFTDGVWDPSPEASGSLQGGRVIYKRYNIGYLIQAVMSSRGVVASRPSNFV